MIQNSCPPCRRTNLTPASFGTIAHPRTVYWALVPSKLHDRRVKRANPGGALDCPSARSIEHNKIFVIALRRDNGLSAWVRLDARPAPWLPVSRALGGHPYVASRFDSRRRGGGL